MNNEQLQYNTRWPYKMENLIYVGISIIFFAKIYIIKWIKDLNMDIKSSIIIIF